MLEPFMMKGCKTVAKAAGLQIELRLMSLLAALIGKTDS